MRQRASHVTLEHGRVGEHVTGVGDARSTAARAHAHRRGSPGVAREPKSPPFQAPRAAAPTTAAIERMVGVGNSDGALGPTGHLIADPDNDELGGPT